MLPVSAINLQLVLVSGLQAGNGEEAHGLDDGHTSIVRGTAARRNFFNALSESVNCLVLIAC